MFKREVKFGAVMESLKLRGNEAFKKGNFEEAVSLYQQAFDSARQAAQQSPEKAAQIKKETAAIHSNASCALLKLGRLEDALHEAHGAIDARQDWNKGWFRKGEVLFAQQKFVEAEEAYKKALDLAGGVESSLKQCVFLALEAQQGFFFRQLSPGRDFCSSSTSNPIESQIFKSARQMRNYVYLVGDAKSREVVVVDGAWDVNGIVEYAESQKVKLVGAVVTHYHFDHTGGIPPAPFNALGITVPGIKELATIYKLPVYVNRNDAQKLRHKNGVPASSLRELEDNATLTVGEVSMKFLHTPGHTPGSQCVFIERASGHDEGLLLSGDTLFIGSCGRLDLPDCDAKAMRDSLQSKLAHLPDFTRVYPGHDYGGAFTSIGAEKLTGLLRPISEQEWVELHS